jgi:hypothetical protein
MFDLGRKIPPPAGLGVRARASARILQTLSRDARKLSVASLDCR